MMKWVKYVSKVRLIEKSSCFPQVADCYMKLSSWNEVAEWQKHVSSLRKQCSDSDVQHSLMADVDMNYVK